MSVSTVRELARPEILELEPYASARASVPEAEGLVRLDANESPWAAFPAQEGLNRYPEPQPARLVERLASLYGAPKDHVLVGRGSDEAIDVLVRVFCRPSDDAVVICPPTFGFYRVAAEVQGARVVSVPRDDGFALDFDAIASAAAADEASVKLVFLCTPNNPTANASDPGEIVALAERLSRQILVVDEAYVEFSENESLSSRVSELPNVVVLRTLSKAHGLAGARLGAALAQPEIVALMRRVLAPYPIPTPTARAALEALTPHGLATMRERVARLTRARDELGRHLVEARGVRRVYPSDTNFLLLAVDDAPAFSSQLRARGILVREFGSKLPGFVRVSVGTEEENALLLDALGLDRREPSPVREAVVIRRTRETSITVSVELDRGVGADVHTGIGFYDHMLEQVAKHGGFKLRLRCEGDLDVDAHHTVEDCALALGEALRQALGDKRGIERYGFVLPMDEARAEVLVDLSGRAAALFEARFPDRRVGELATELVPHFFQSFAQSLGAAIHVRVDGLNTHHMVESSFKALGRALRQAIRRSGSDVPSTKGTL